MSSRSWHWHPTNSELRLELPNSSLINWEWAVEMPVMKFSRLYPRMIENFLFQIRKFPSSSFTVTNLGIGWTSWIEEEGLEWNTCRLARFAPETWCCWRSCRVRRRGVVCCHYNSDSDTMKVKQVWYELNFIDINLDYMERYVIYIYRVIDTVEILTNLES